MKHTAHGAWLAVIALSCGTSPGEDVAHLEQSLRCDPLSPNEVLYNVNRPVTVPLTGGLYDDQWPTIQAAVDAAAPGARLVLEDHTYFVSQQVLVQKDIVISGQGPFDTAITLIDRALPSNAIQFRNCSNCGIEDLRVDGNHNAAGYHCVRVANTTRFLASNVLVRKCGSYGIGLQAGCLVDTTLTRTVAQDTGADGIDFKNKEWCTSGTTLSTVLIQRPGKTKPKQAAIDVRGDAQLFNIHVDGLPGNSPWGIRFREDGEVNGPGGGGSTIHSFVIRGSGAGIGLGIYDSPVDYGSHCISNVSVPIAGQL